MNTLYFDCTMGAAGDMLLGALFALCPMPDLFLHAFDALQLPGVALVAQPVTQAGCTGVHMCVTIDGHEETQHPHSHRTLSDVQKILQYLPVSDWVKAQTNAIYNRIAQSEAAAHQMPVSLVHFHEVGALDAIADIVGVSMLLEQLSPAQILASPISTGRGKVTCAHGTLPVPAPATAYLLQNLPTQPGPAEISGELCTPTGAALLSHFVQRFGPPPAWADAKYGKGFGTKQFPLPNCVTAWLG